MSVEAKKCMVALVQWLEDMFPAGQGARGYSLGHRIGEDSMEMKRRVRDHEQESIPATTPLALASSELSSSRETYQQPTMRARTEPNPSAA
jgi:hypothetical protein